MRITTFIDQETAYICLNNLEDANKQLQLASPSTAGSPTEVTLRRLYVPNREKAQYTIETLNATPATLQLRAHETAILILRYEQAIAFTKHIESRHHYSPTQLVAIQQDQPLEFEFTNVPTGKGKAYLRMSLGRKHDRSKQPALYVNGTQIDVPTHWAGYDQSNRIDFFGAIEVPFPHELLTPTTTVQLKFPDSGGHVSTVVLRTETIVE